MPSEEESFDRFSAGEAARIAGVSYANLDYWARTKLVIPSITEAKGSGTERRYSFRDVVALRVLRELREAGMSTNALAKAVKRLSKDGWPSPLSQCRLVGMGTDIYFIRGCRQLEGLFRRPGQSAFAFMLDLEKTIKSVKQDVKALRAA